MKVTGITDSGLIELASGAQLDVYQLNSWIQLEVDNRAAELEQIIDAAEAANYKHLQRMEQLEQLCRDMYDTIFDRTYDEVSTPEHNEFMKRMDELGLLEED